MSKQECCAECLFNKHETIGCTWQQLRWALEDLVVNFPCGEKLIPSHSECDHFLQEESFMRFADEVNRHMEAFFSPEEETHEQPQAHD